MQDAIWSFLGDWGGWLLLAVVYGIDSVEMWCRERKLRRLSRLATTIWLSREGWERAVQGELGATEFCMGVESIHRALLKEPVHPSEEFRHEWREYPFYLAASFAAGCGRALRCCSDWVRERLSRREKAEAPGGGTNAAV